MSPRSPSADFQRPASLSPQHYLSDPESCRDEASTRVHHIHPFGLSLTCNTQSEWVSLGFSLSFAPGNYSPRTSGREPVSDTDRELRLGHLHPTSNRRTHSTRATSCRTSPRHERAASPTWNPRMPAQPRRECRIRSTASLIMAMRRRYVSGRVRSSVCGWRKPLRLAPELRGCGSGSATSGPPWGYFYGNVGIWMNPHYR
jgi:hypothetical protein